MRLIRNNLLAGEVFERLTVVCSAGEISIINKCGCVSASVVTKLLSDTVISLVVILVLVDA